MTLRPEWIVLMLKRKVEGEDRVIDVQSFIINGEDVIPIFSDTETFKAQAEGSGFEENGLEIKLDFYLSLLNGDEIYVLNPGGLDPKRLTVGDLKNWGNE